MLAFFYVLYNNGQMLGEENKLKDTNSQAGLSITDTIQPPISYTKSNKLVMALFMVTDIMDIHEPLRLKLRTLGTEIISDIGLDAIKSGSKIREVLSFLDIAQTVGLVSQMNNRILRNEFLKLLGSVEEYGRGRAVWIEDFLGGNMEDEGLDESKNYSELVTRRHTDLSRTRPSPVNIGMQKAGNLMSVLKGINPVGSVSMSDRKNHNPNRQTPSFDVLKKHRRADIVSVLKNSEVGLTITDIRNKSKGQKDVLSALYSCGEKTLQRELVAMVKDGVLKREGEKRWSRYSIN